MSSDCCSVTETREKEIDRCPQCGEKGKSVTLATVGAMVKIEVEAVRLSAGAYKLCHNLSCPVVYFAPEISIEKADLRVSVNFKEKDYEGPVCYCFNHTVASIREEIHSSGRSTAVDMITKEIKAGRCACEVKNPAGTCCLGDVVRVVKSLPVQLPTDPDQISSGGVPKS